MFSSPSRLKSPEGEDLLQENGAAVEFDMDENEKDRPDLKGQLRDVVAGCLGKTRLLRHRHWLSALGKTAHFFRPSFLQRHDPHAHNRPVKVYPTAFLDGMRGVAASSVMFAHWVGWIYEHQQGWGAHGGHYDFFRLPIISLFYHGSIQVNIFFVISGYVLAYRPIRFLRRRKFLEFDTVLSSLLLRRWARLFLPIAASTFTTAMLLQLGAYELVRDFQQDKTYMTNRSEPHVKPQPTFSGELWHWLGQQWLITRGVLWGDVRDDAGLQYDTHLWTIPVEMKCSLYLFLTLLGTSRLRTIFRFCLVSIVMVHSLHRSHWDLVLFLSGMVIAECDDIRGAHDKDSSLPVTDGSTAKRVKRWNIFWIAMSIVALLLLSQPEIECANTPGWRTLCKTIPSWMGANGAGLLYQRTGAILWVAAVSRVSFWKRLYETRVAQYLGDISYTTYLVHGMVNHTVGLAAEMVIFKYITGVEGGMRLVGFIISTIIYLACVIWLADLFWRGVDRPVVRFARWAETKVSISNI